MQTCKQNVKPRSSYWADIFSYFSKITHIKYKNNGFTLVVTGIRNTEEVHVQTTYHHKKVAKAVGNKLKNISGV